MSQDLGAVGGICSRSEGSRLAWGAFWVKEMVGCAVTAEISESSRLKLNAQFSVLTVHFTVHTERCRGEVPAVIQCTMYLTLHSFSLKLCSATIDLKTKKIYGLNNRPDVAGAVL